MPESIKERREKLQIKVRGMGDAVASGNTAEYRRILETLPAFAAAAEVSYESILKAREYDQIFKHDKGDMVAALCETQTSFPIVDYFALAGVGETAEENAPLRPKSTMALFDSHEFLNLARAKAETTLQLVTSVAKNPQESSPPIIEHLFTTSCKQHGIKAASLARPIFQALFRDDALMEQANPSVVSNLRTLAQYAEPEKLTNWLNTMLSAHKQKIPTGAALTRDQNRLEAVIRYLPVDAVTRAESALSAINSPLKSIVLTQKARHLERKDAAERAEADPILQFRKLPVEKRIEHLQDALDTNDLKLFDQYFTLLITTTNPLEHMAVSSKLSRVVDQVIRDNKASFLKTCLSGDFNIMTNDRLRNAGLTGYAPLKQEIAVCMMKSAVFKEKILDSDTVIPDILSKLTHDKPDFAVSLMKHIQKLYEQNQKSENLAPLAYDVLLRHANSSHSQANPNEMIALCIDIITPQHAQTLLETITDKSGTALSSHPDMIDMLLAKIPQEQLPELSRRAASSSPDLLVQIENTTGFRLSDSEILRAAATGGIQTDTTPSLRMLQILFDRNSHFNAGELLEAASVAVEHQRPSHAAAILKVAEAQGFSIINSCGKKGKTLLTQTLTLKHAPQRQQLVDLLVQNGADNRNDNLENNPMSLMASLGLDKTPSYLHLKQIQEKMTDLGFIGQEEEARMSARFRLLGKAIEQLIGLGYSDQDAKQVALGMVGMTPPAQPTRPALGDYTQKEQQRRLSSPDNEGPDVNGVG